MRKLLTAVSAVALSVGFVATAEAASLRGADVNVVNIAVNVVPETSRWGNPAIDGSINISATRGGSVGHQGWHGDLKLGKTETSAIGAVNQANTYVGRDRFNSEESLSGGVFIGAEGLNVGEITHLDVHEDGYRSSQGAHYFDVDGVNYWAVRGGLGIEMTDNFSGSYVPDTNVINAAVNLENIDGSANYYTDRGGSIDNIGAISTSAIGALNVTTATIGVPGGISDLGSAGASDL